MKKFSILCLLIVITLVQARAQGAFSNVSLASRHNINMLCFTLSSEANVLHYRIEASNDNDEFEVIGTLKASGNSVLSKTYSYALSGKEYKYYRIAKVNMNGSLQYSYVISIPKPALNNKVNFD